jgi:hypothetical protein
MRNAESLAEFNEIHAAVDGDKRTLLGVIADFGTGSILQVVILRVRRQFTNREIEKKSSINNTSQARWRISI